MAKLAPPGAAHMVQSHHTAAASHSLLERARPRLPEETRPRCGPSRHHTGGPRRCQRVMPLGAGVSGSPVRNVLPSPELAAVT